MAIIKQVYETIEERNKALEPIREQINTIDEQIGKLKDEREDIAFSNGGIKSDNRVKEPSEENRKALNDRLKDISEEITILQRKRSGMKGMFYRIQGARINQSSTI